MKGLDSGPHALLTIKQYEEINAGTDRNPALNPSDLHLPLIGLFGETGSLVTLIKKKWRDTNAYRRLHEDLIEEVGDLLWYITNVSKRASLSLETIIRSAFPELQEFTPAKGLAFLDIDRLTDERPSVDPDVMIASLAKLGNSAATILTGFHDQTGFISFIPQLLANIILALREVCLITGISLDDAARYNIKKTQDRWPIKEKSMALFDVSYNEHEQLPRSFIIEFEEITSGEKSFVYQKFNGVHVGDRLTDNINDPDYYRFHDVFHWAYAAILGWSPVTRSLLRCKRKSNPIADENQDGARAGIIEEAISVWIFHQAKDMDLFENITSLDFHILKAVRDLTKGFEAETIPIWLWERAILEGYKVFRELKKHRRGFVEGNLNDRIITFFL